MTARAALSALDPAAVPEAPPAVLGAALANAELGELLAAIAAAGDRRAWFLAPSGLVLARSAPAAAPVSTGDTGHGADADQLTSRATGGSFNLVIDGEPARVLPLDDRGRHHGYLAVGLLPTVERIGRFDPDPLTTTETLLQACALPLIIQRTCHDAARPAMDDMGTWLIHELQGPGATVAASTEAVARRLGVDLDRPFAAAVLSCEQASDHRWQVAQRWVGRPVATAGRRLLTVIGGGPGDLDQVADRLSDALGGLAVVAAAGPVVHEPGSAPRSFKQAEVIHALACDRGSAQRVSRRDLGTTGVLLDLPSWQLQAFVDRHLAPLEGREDLMATVRAWLSERGNRGAIAARLHLHRNSVAHRLQRLSELLGVDLEDPAVWLDLWCALEARHVLAARARLGHR